MESNKIEYDLVENHFSAIYLTMIALIQGIVLSTLAGGIGEDIMQSVQQIEGQSDNNLYFLYIFLKEYPWERYITAFLVIFLVWHHYMYGVIYLRWFPGVLDTLLPLLLGITQFLSIRMIRESNPSMWLFFLSLFFLFGALAYSNAAIKTKAPFFSCYFGNEISIKYSKLITRTHGLAGISCFFLSILILLATLRGMNQVGWIAVLLIVHISLYEIFYLMKIKPYYIFMLKEKDK